MPKNTYLKYLIKIYIYRTVTIGYYCLPKLAVDTAAETANTFINRVFDTQDLFGEIGQDLNICWREIIYLCLIALAFSLVITALLR